MGMNYQYLPDTIPEGLDRDVTAELNDWFAGLPDGTPDNETIVVLDGRVYRTDGTVTVFAKSYFGIAGLGAHLVRVQEPTTDSRVIRSLAHVRFQRCNRFWFNRLTVIGVADDSIGYQAAREAQHAFDLQSCHHLRSASCSAEKVWGDLYCFSPDSNRANYSWCEDAEIVDPAGYTHRHTFTGTGIRDLRVRGGNPRAVRAFMDLEPNGTRGGATNVSVNGKGGFYTHGLNLLSSIAAGGTIADVRFRNVRSNNLKVQVGRPEGTCNFTDFSFTDNVGTESLGVGYGAVMIFKGVHGTVTVTGNTEPYNRNRRMVMARCEPELEPPDQFVYEDNCPDQGA